MTLGKIYSLLSGFVDNFKQRPIVVWNLDEDKQEDSIYYITGVHWVDELGATVIKIKRKVR